MYLNTVLINSINSFIQTFVKLVGRVQVPYAHQLEPGMHIHDSWPDIVTHAA